MAASGPLALMLVELNFVLHGFILLQLRSKSQEIKITHPPLRLPLRLDTAPLFGHGISDPLEAN